MTREAPKGFEIIVAPVCGSEENGWRICGNDKLRQVVLDPISAEALALSERGSGLVVILRPQFNEPHLGKYAFREYRSFDGGLFEEIHFTLGANTSKQKRLDNEIVLPSPPIS